RFAEALQTHLAGQVRRLLHAAGQGADAGNPAGRARFPLPGGTAHRRGAASADLSVGGTLWQGAAQPERRAATTDRTLEVRIQEHQVHCSYPLYGADADNNMEPAGIERIRVLFERESARRSSEVEPEARTPAR